MHPLHRSIGEAGVIILRGAYGKRVRISSDSSEGGLENLPSGGSDYSNRGNHFLGSGSHGFTLSRRYAQQRVAAGLLAETERLVM
jgi:hypothetical protein